VSEHDRWWNLSLFCNQVHPLKCKIAAQTENKSREKTKSREEPKHPVGCGNQKRFGSGSHHGPWWALPGLFRYFLNVAFCVLPYTAGFALDQLSWAYWACFC